MQAARMPGNPRPYPEPVMGSQRLARKTIANNIRLTTPSPAARQTPASRPLHPALATAIAAAASLGAFFWVMG